MVQRRISMLVEAGNSGRSASGLLSPGTPATNPFRGFRSIRQMILRNKNFPLLGPSRPALLGALAALVFAAHCAGAPGTPAVTGLTTSASGSGGFIFDGTRLWTA